MIYIFILCVISFACIIAREFLFMRERGDWQKERQKLLDRVQARDLPEFKAFDEPVEQPKKDDKPTVYDFI